MNFWMMGSIFFGDFFFSNEKNKNKNKKFSHLKGFFGATFQI
jgi:hypothetical protein